MGRSARRRATRTAVALVVASLISAALPAAGVEGSVPAHPRPAAETSPLPWAWPLAGFRLDEPYAAPAHDYAPGHRGIDLRPLVGLEVFAPSAGVVAFSGAVAGRGILTIDHGGGLVTTFEPIESALRPGDPVGRGAEVGVVALGGHAAAGSLHFGVRRDGAYINPLLLLGGVPRAVLLPCC